MTDPRVPRNTTDAIHNDPAEALLFLGTALSGGPAAAIEAQEAAGQREMVNSTVIPTKVLHSTEKDLTDLGFTLGPVVEGDPMFREATLPDGWKREGSNHSMWSYIVDQLGRRRCSIFYKAAFYDRDAHISATSVDGYVYECFYNDTLPVLDDEWASREAVLAAIVKAHGRAVHRVDEYREVGMDTAEEEKQVAAWGALRSKVEERA